MSDKVMVDKAELERLQSCARIAGSRLNEYAARLRIMALDERQWANAGTWKELAETVTMVSTELHDALSALAPASSERAAADVDWQAQALALGSALRNLLDEVWDGHTAYYPHPFTCETAVVISQEFEAHFSAPAVAE